MRQLAGWLRRLPLHCQRKSEEFAIGIIATAGCEMRR